MQKRAAAPPSQRDYKRGVAAGIAWTRKADRVATRKLGSLLQRANKRGLEHLFQTIPTVHKVIAPLHPDDCGNASFCAGFSIGVIKEFTRQVAGN